MAAKTKFILGGIVIIAAVACLIFMGFQEGKTYYLTVDELAAMKQKPAGKAFRLVGDVMEGSINRTKPQMEFVIGSSQSTIKVRYIGKKIIPDTFKDGSKAVVEGNLAPDGIFEARIIEAKCASKYEEKYKERTTS